MVERKDTAEGGRPVGEFTVCLVSRDEPGPTGTSRYVDSLREGLLRHGLSVVDLKPRPAGLVARGLRTVAAPLHVDALTFLEAYPPYLRWPRSDIYHLTGHTYASSLLLSRPKRATVATVYDIVPYIRWRSSSPSSLRERIHRRADSLALRQLRKLDLILTISEWSKGTLVDELGISPDRVVVTLLGVDFHRYRPLEVPAEFRERHGLAADRRYVLCVGSEDSRKNLKMVWRAFQVVQRHQPEAVLLKVGTSFDPVARAELHSLSKELGVDGSIHYFDRVDEADLPLFYNVSDLLVMPSLYEGFGLPALEAMASGKPVVVSDRASLPEITGPEAVVVDPDDPESIADGILDLLTNGRRAADLGLRGRQRALGFQWERTVQQTLAAYRLILP